MPPPRERRGALPEVALAAAAAAAAAVQLLRVATQVIVGQWRHAPLLPLLLFGFA
jgi:hypothetical protein